MTLLLGACSSKIPPQISEEPANAPTLAQVRENPDTFRDSLVRWGGVILNTENRDGSSWITIVALPLDSSGKPTGRDSSLGRFIAVIDDFVEPLVYSKDRRITVSGNITGMHTAKVGDYPYDHPLVQTDLHYLWPKTVAVPANYYPYPYYWPGYYPWYHPFYDPFPHRVIPHRH
jgi:outer membrane lipoprotein